MLMLLIGVIIASYLVYFLLSSFRSSAARRHRAHGDEPHALIDQQVAALDARIAVLERLMLDDPDVRQR